MRPKWLRFFCKRTNRPINFFLLILLFFLSTKTSLKAQPSFNAPDTVCTGTPVNITNTSSNASTYFWNFCAADLISTPTGVNMGNIGGLFSAPVFMDYAYYNGNYYGFSTNYNPGKLVRLNFGNSLLNTPTATDLGNFGGNLTTGAGTEGIQIVFNENKWYAIIVGGWVGSGHSPRIVKIAFGANLANNTPVSTNWGNLGNMSQPIDLHVFQEGSNWYGLTVNAENNSITRFNFTTSFDNTPTAVNLGNIGNLAYPTGIYSINDNGFWRVFIVNGGDNTRQSGTYSLTRLDFGSSLLNTPVGINLGNPGGYLQHPRDLTIMKSCGQILGFAVNGHLNNSSIVRFDFNNDLSSVPLVSSLGSIGNVNFPHSISKLFRVGADIYGFITNAGNHTMTRLRFSGCSGSSIPTSSQQNPGPVSYNSPGEYFINLTVDDGLATQNAFCKKVVVVPAPVKSPVQQLNLCSGSSIKVGSPVKPASYVWNTSSTEDSITISAPGTYWVESNRYGCSVRDSFIITTNPTSLDFSFNINTCNPKIIQFNSHFTSGQNISWDFGDGQGIVTDPNPLHTFPDFGNYSVSISVLDNYGCNTSTSKIITVFADYDPNLVVNSDISICPGDSVLLINSATSTDNCWVTQGSPPVGNYVFPQTTTTYSLYAQSKGSNLVTNGNFDDGNNSFSSDYLFNPGSGLNQGVYNISSNIQSWNSNFSGCQDHSSGSGNMLMVNGADLSNAKVWYQTIPVMPNTNYRFSAWAQNIATQNPAQIQLFINGGPVGSVLNVNNQSCIWEEAYTTWNSGSATSAQLSIVNLNQNLNGNDFALDDIYFGTVSHYVDSFTVNVGEICDSLDISGPSKICNLVDTVNYFIYRDNCNYPFTVHLDNAFVELVSQSSDVVKVLFKQEGNTTIKIEINNGCAIYLDSVNVQVRPSPNSINLGPDLTTCKDTSFVLQAGLGFENYQWQNGSSTSSILVTAPGTYSVEAQNYCGETFSDIFVYSAAQVLPFAVFPTMVNVCLGDSVDFTASGGDQFSWSPSGKFKNPSSGFSRAIADFNGQFSVFISDNVCNRDTTIMIPVTVTDKADIKISKTNDVNCSVDTAILTATGGVNYTWASSPYIIRTNNNTITVKPPVTSTFYVFGNNALGCTGQDSVVVEFSRTGQEKLFMPNAFTPNMDGLNDIYRAAFIGPAKQFDFRIYNRWGEMIFRSNNPEKGWDGTYKGKQQPRDVYVYYITAEGGCDGKFVQKGTFVLIR